VTSAVVREPEAKSRTAEIRSVAPRTTTQQLVGSIICYPGSSIVRRPRIIFIVKDEMDKNKEILIEGQLPQEVLIIINNYS
jgi:hypothetical protein